MKTKLITTVHWAVPEEFKKHVEESNGLYFLVFGGGSKRLEELNDSWLKERCVPDDTNEDNISNLNPYLNEMTSIYTVWKNQGLLPPDTEAIGHAHYRRFFTQEDVDELDKYDALIASPASVRVAGFGCTLEKQYTLCHFKEDFDILKNTIEEVGLMDKEVWSEWTQLGYLYAPCNLFVLRREWFDKYCSDLFKVALKLPERIDVTGRDDYQRRACSFLCERFTSYWFYTQVKRGRMKVVEKPCQFHPEWKATNSTDTRGCYNGKFVKDNSLDIVAKWVKETQPAFRWQLY